MENFLIAFIFITGIIVVTSIINEKMLHIQQNIALVLVSFIVSVFVIILQNIDFQNNLFDGSFSLDFLRQFRFDSFLLECVICFMLFASASNVHVSKFIHNIVPIAYLSVFTTIISSVVYGIIFYGINLLLGMNLDIWHCVLLGCIISPTEPIAITSVLKKIGASKSILSVMEGEALFNHGVSLILYIFVSSIIKVGNAGNIFVILFKEILGALAIGLAISWCLFKLIKMSNNPIIHILISLLTVALSVVLCNSLGFSGDIASVICGIYFTYQNHKIHRWKEVVDSEKIYNDFWNIVGNLLNCIFFVLIGFSVIYMDFNLNTLVLIPVAVILNLVSRVIGIGTSTVLIGKDKIPSKYKFREFIMLMTTSGLKGVLSLVLVMNAKAIMSQSAYMILLSVTMITLLFTTIVQGLITKKVYYYIDKKRDERALVKK